MAIPLSDNILVNAPKPADDKYGPFADDAAAQSAVPETFRYKGMMVAVDPGGSNPVVLKWYQNGTGNGDLVDFPMGSSLIDGSGTTVNGSGDGVNLGGTVTTDATYTGATAGGGFNFRWRLGYIDTGEGTAYQHFSQFLGDRVTHNIKNIGPSGQINPDETIWTQTYTSFQFALNRNSVNRSSTINMIPDLFSLQYESSGNNKSIAFGESNAGIIVTDTMSSLGLVYDGDYSANYTDRSITDKLYQDDHLIGYETSLIKNINLGAGPGAAQDGLPLVWNNAGNQFAFGSAVSLSNGQGTTANGTAIDLGGSFTSDIFITSTNENRFRITSNDANASAERETYLDITDLNWLLRTEEQNNGSFVLLRGLMDAGDEPRFNVIADRPDGGGSDISQFDVKHNQIFLRVQDATTSGFSQLTMSSTGVITITDTFNTQGIALAADYQSNFSNFTLIHKLYADTRINGKSTSTIDGLNGSTGPGATENGYALTWNNSLGQYVLTSVGGSLVVGSNNTVPHSNSTGDGYDHDSNFTFSGSTLAVNNVQISTNGTINLNSSSGSNAISGNGQGTSNIALEVFALTQGNDTGSNAAMRFNVASNIGGSLSTRPLYHWRNGNNVIMQILGNEGLVFGSTTTGGSLGIGTINAKGYYIDGVAVGGGIAISGTPAVQQIGIWDGASSMRGRAQLNYDGGNALNVGNVKIIGGATQSTQKLFISHQGTNSGGEILGLQNGVNAALSIVGRVESGSDSGGEATINFVGRVGASTSVATRPLFRFYNNTSTLMTIGNDGNFTVQPGFQISDGVESIRLIASTGVQFESTNDNMTLFFNGTTFQNDSDTNLLRLNSAGDFLMIADNGNTTSASFQFKINNNAADDSFNISGTAVTTGQNFLPRVNNTYSIGNATFRFTEIFATNGVINTSDISEKNVVSGKKLGLDFINKLDTIAFKWKQGSDDKVHLGFSANQIQDLVDETYAIVVEGEKLGLRHTELLQPIVASIQELSKKVDQLMNK